MTTFTPISSSHLVANSEGQLFLQASGDTAIDVTKFMKQLADECGKAAKAASQSDEMLTAEQVAKFLNCSLATVHRFTANGSIPSVKIGHLRRYPRSKLLALPEANKSLSKS